MMLSRLRNLFGSAPPAPAPTRAPPLGSGSPTHSATVVKTTSEKADTAEVPTPKIVAPAPVPPPAPTGIELFLQAQDDRQREKVLKTHPFWQQERVEQLLNSQQVAAVIGHISDAHSDLSYAFMHYDDDDHDLVDRHSRGVEWAAPDEYRHWHERALALIQEHPADKQTLLDAMHQHLMVVSSTDHGHTPYDWDATWLQEAQDILHLGGKVSTEALLNGLLSIGVSNDFRCVTKTFVENPLIAAEFQKKERDEETLAWTKDNYKRALLLTSHHPRLNAWAISDAVQDHSLVTILSEKAKDGALLKAWHGIALSGEETLQHPLAYSLYVHKHAPIYLEEAQPLPQVWHMALSLSTTGVEFQEMLLNAAHIKMNPEQQPEILELPDLEP